MDLDGRPSDVPSLIHGTDENGSPVTLFGCSCDSPSNSVKLPTIEILCLAAILNAKIAYANQKTLAARIAEVLNDHKQEAAVLTAGIPDFANKVKHTRNYYTHYGEEGLEDGKVARGRELSRISLAPEGLIGTCLLKEIGVVGQPLEMEGLPLKTQTGTPRAFSGDACRPSRLSPHLICPMQASCQADKQTSYHARNQTISGYA